MVWRICTTIRQAATRCFMVISPTGNLLSVGVTSGGLSLVHYFSICLLMISLSQSLSLKKYLFADDLIEAVSHGPVAWWCPHPNVRCSLWPLRSNLFHITKNSITTGKSHKDLGIFIDSKLTFVPHVDYIVAKPNRTLGICWCHCRNLDPKTKQILLLSLDLVLNLFPFVSIH